MGGAHFGDAAESLAKVAASAVHGDLEVVLVDVVHLVCGGEDLALVDEVDADSLQDLSLHEVADARLRGEGAATPSRQTSCRVPRAL